MPDYIEREPLLEYAVCGNSRAVGFVPVRFILDAPAIKMVPERKAKWINVKMKQNGALKIGIACSACYRQPKDRVTESLFCPSCGASMTNGHLGYNPTLDYSELAMSCPDARERERLLAERQYKIDCERLNGKVPSNDEIRRRTKGQGR